MISNKSATDLGYIASRGGSLEVDGGRYSATDLGYVASRLTDNGTLRIVNSDSLSSTDLGYIAGRAPTSAQVIFA